jgi:hypothetical protein
VAEKKIGSIEFRCTPLPAMQTVTLGRRIANLFGPAIHHLIAAMQAQSKDAAASDQAALAAFGVIASNLDERFDDLVKELAEMTQIKHGGRFEDTIVDVHIEDAGTLMLAAFFAAEVNLKGFFSGPLAKALASRMPVSPKAS